MSDDDKTVHDAENSHRSLRPVERWSSWRTITTSAERCRESVLPLIDRKTGRTFTLPGRCDSWSCEECAPEKTRPLLRFYEKRFAREPRIWISRIKVSGNRRTISQRARRKHASAALRVEHWSGQE